MAGCGGGTIPDWKQPGDVVSGPKPIWDDTDINHDKINVSHDKFPVPREQKINIPGFTNPNQQ
ncbi:MAG: hypothetical protein NTZ53_00220 [Cyanobacteria bacterium]|nr:hypothetical protein [Cyanobacteriota bacterium]